MDRRHFLKLASAAAGAAAFTAVIPWGEVDAATSVVSFKGLLYRGDRHGRILVSSDSGATWRVQANLGKMYAVKKLAVDSTQRLTATITYRHHRFGLVFAPETAAWRTT